MPQDDDSKSVFDDAFRRMFESYPAQPELTQLNARLPEYALESKQYEIPEVRALTAVAAERLAQDAKWGPQNHPDADPVLLGRPGGADGQRLAEDLEIPNAARAKFLCRTAGDRGCDNWAAILVEEVSEAVDAIGDDAALRAELVQVAAVAVAWVEAIDRRLGPAVADGQEVRVETPDIGLYDSDTGESLKTERVVDITACCPRRVPGDQVLMLYTTAKRGRIVQFYAGSVKGGGVGTHVFLDEPTAEEMSRHIADVHLGIDVSRLMQLARKWAPPLGTPPDGTDAEVDDAVRRQIAAHAAWDAPPDSDEGSAP